MHVLNITAVAHAAHKLDMIGLPTGHPCTRLHGHSYRISVEIATENNPVKLVVDFGAAKKAIMDRYDHAYLNEVMTVAPTAENMAKDIHDYLTEALHMDGETVQITNVTVAETDNNVATYVPEPDMEE